MPDKQLLRLLGEDKRYIYRAVAWMLTGSLGSIGFTACLCYGLQLLLADAKASLYLLPFVLGAVCAAVRFLATTRAAAVRDRLGRSVKKSLRAQLYAKLLRLGVWETKTVKMAGLTQLATEGIEQLDLYYSSYLPQFFYAMLSPLLLFGICVFINWRVAAVLLACVPLIPVSIVAVSRFAKRIFARYWGKYTAMGDVFLDSVQGLKELKLFRADARQQAYMNENAEEFRKITMKVLVMQLASVTIMDLVAFGGAGIGAALAVSGTQNGGGIAAALFLVLVAAEFFLPLRAFGSAFHVAMNGVSAGRMMLTLLEEPEPAWGKVQPCGGRLELEDVHFSYAPGRETLHGVSAVFPERGMTAIVGESSCGKTTVAKLLTGALCPDSGRVLLDGKPVESLDRQAYYASLAHVSCETFLFHDTIRANFLLANPHAAELMKLLGGRLSAVMLLAVLNGSLGFLCAMGVPFFGAVGIAKALGESISLSYGAIAALCVGCGVLRVGLWYLEQYGNHYIAFRLLAVLRDKIFTKLRALCPAKLESRQKGSLLTMITADIETLEVFYAHTVSPSASPCLCHWR